VSPKRLDHVAPPPVGDEWSVRFGTTEAAKDWYELWARASVKTREAYELMRANPRPPRDESHYRLSGDLGTRIFGDKVLEQWQIKVGGGARIWYLPDDEKRTVWVVYAGVAHPKETEKR
jgi:hypothetical protein